MARPLRIDYPGAFYHVMNRGLEYRTIYRDKTDYDRFLKIIHKAHLRFGVILHAYCLMPNHYHLLLETPKGHLSRALKHIDGVYTQGFNRKPKRVGPLFQGRFKSILVDMDTYALQVSRYIHLNPVKAHLCEAPEKYPYSSMAAFIGRRDPGDDLETKFILGYFSKNIREARKRMARFTREGMKAGPAKDWDPFHEALAGTILAGQEFMKKARKDRVPAGPDGTVSRLRHPQNTETIQEMAERVRKLGLDAKLTRKLTGYYLTRNGHWSLGEVGKELGGMKISAVCRMVSRFEEYADRKPEFRKALETLAKMSIVNLALAYHREDGT